MKNEKMSSDINQIDDQIQTFIKKKKDENSALKKLLSALESAKKNATMTTNRA
jgi:hypothetical protein